MAAGILETEPERDAQQTAKDVRCVSWQFTAPWGEVDKRVCGAPWRGSLCLFFLTKEKTCSTL